MSHRAEPKECRYIITINSLVKDTAHAQNILVVVFPPEWESRLRETDVLVAEPAVIAGNMDKLTQVKWVQSTFAGDKTAGCSF